VDFEPGSGIIRYPVERAALPVVSQSSLGGTFEGRAVHLVTVGAGGLGTLANQYANHRAVLKDSLGTVVGELRILGHTESGLFLDPADGILPPQTHTLEVVAKFFEVRTNGTPGLGPLYEPLPQAPRIPIANLQIGFAFHEDPSAPELSQGKDLKRFPQELGTFVHDLATPAAREQLRSLHYTYVQMDVRFNIDYTDNNPGQNAGANRPGPGSPIPELAFLLLPYRF
jgi:hypothetical protein